MTVTVELEVNGITPEHKLEIKLTDLEGVHGAEVNSEEQLIKIEYNSDDITLDIICTFIEIMGIKIVN